ncbi:MAG: MaoC family dehydratase [Proteobacteria bacterium]|nr:MaoC family dehydratase [Pseudomonadota bacterium]
MKYWEDFEVGTQLEFGKKTVTEEEIIRYAEKFDPQPFHIDKEAAAEHYYRGIIASGWHTAAMCMRMMVDGYLLDAASNGSPGVEELRWKQPVRPGETLHVKAEVLDRSLPKSRPELGFVKFSHKVFNQDGDLKMTMVSSGMFSRRPSDIKTLEANQ